MTAQASTAAPLTMDQLAAVIAHDIPEGSYVNLGIGQPTKIADHLPKDESGNINVILHTENGMLNMGPAAADDEVDPDLTNAGKVPVTELPGASYFHQADSFAMMRGGHLDVCVLGAFRHVAGGRRPAGPAAAPRRLSGPAARSGVVAQPGQQGHDPGHQQHQPDHGQRGSAESAGLAVQRVVGAGQVPLLVVSHASWVPLSVASDPTLPGGVDRRPVARPAQAVSPSMATTNCFFTERHCSSSIPRRQ